MDVSWNYCVNHFAIYVNQTSTLCALYRWMISQWKWGKGIKVSMSSTLPQPHPMSQRDTPHPSPPCPSSWTGQLLSGRRTNWPTRKTELRERCGEGGNDGLWMGRFRVFGGTNGWTWRKWVGEERRGALKRCCGMCIWISSNVLWET